MQYGGHDRILVNLICPYGRSNELFIQPNLEDENQMKVNFDLSTLITTDHYNQYITYVGSLSECGFHCYELFNGFLNGSRLEV